LIGGPFRDYSNAKVSSSYSREYHKRVPHSSQETLESSLKVVGSIEILGSSVYESLSIRWDFMFWGGLGESDEVLCTFWSSENRFMYNSTQKRESLNYSLREGPEDLLWDPKEPLTSRGLPKGKP
jgi:hypothetical protein